MGTHDFSFGKIGVASTPESNGAQKGCSDVILGQVKKLRAATLREAAKVLLNMADEIERGNGNGGVGT